MRTQDTVQPLIGDWRLTAYEGEIETTEDGIILNPIVWQQRRRNLIVTVGKQAILDRLFGLGGLGPVTHTGIGTSGTAAAVGNTALTGGVYKAFDATPVRTGLSVLAITTFGTGEGNINIQEAALAIGAGTTLLNRLAPIGPFNKTSAVSLRIETAITQA
jgi:hypothetical protein